MIVTKEHQEALVEKYVKEKHNQDECIGFIDGLNTALELVKNLTIPRVSNWGELKNACLHSRRHDTFMACLHEDADDAMVCFSPARCPMIKKWSKCNKNSPCY
jgi:hypothetical protein